MIQSHMDSIKKDSLWQSKLLIKMWLKKSPSEDFELFCEEVAEAQWLEERYYTNMNRAIVGKN